MQYNPSGRYNPAVVPREATAHSHRKAMGQRKLQMNPVAAKDYRKGMQIDLESDWKAQLG